MNDIVANTALALKLQDEAGTYAAPDTSDLTPAANVSWKPNDITVESPEYLGSIHRPGAYVIGATYDITFELLLRGPGGVAVPAADAFILGRVLRTIGFTENLVSAAIPAALEDLGTGSTTSTAKLGATAAATADLYKGLAIALPGAGAVTLPLLSMISDYSAAKVASLAETFGSAPTGKYQIPKQLAYVLSGDSDLPLLSSVLWQGSRRFEFVDMAPSAATITFPVAGRDGGNDVPKISVTYNADLHDYSDEESPIVTPGSLVPPFRDGKMHIAGKPMGGSSVQVDFAPRVGYRPNPNRETGSEPAQLVETKRTVTLNLNRTSKAYMDFLALAQAQSVHPVQAMYGPASGAFVGLFLGDVRFSRPEGQAGGDFYTDQINGYIDDPDKSVSLVFPYL